MSRHANNEQFQDLSSYSSVKEYKKKNKNKTARFIFKIVLSVLCTLMIVFGAALVYFSQTLFSGLSTVEMTTDKDALGIKVTASNDSSIKNFAFFGVDERSGALTGRSDTIIIFTVDNKHNKIKMTSILRDTRIDDMSGYGTQKINAAYAYGGYELAIKTLNQNFNLNIEDFVTINFANLAEIIDIFGGIDVELNFDEIYATNDNLYFLREEQKKEGHDVIVKESDFFRDEGEKVYHLNGNQAVAFARIRGAYDGGDTKRADRQKIVLSELIGKLETMDSSEYLPLIQKILPLCKTSLSVADIMECAPIILKDFTIETHSIPTEEENAVGTDLEDGVGWTFIYDLDYAAAHIDRIIYEDESYYWNEYGSEAE